MRIELCPLGIEWIDALTGGIPRGQTSLVLGGPKSGRSSLALGFVIQSLERGNVCYVTSESPESVIQHGDRWLARDFRPDIQLGKLSVLSFAPFLESKLKSLASPEAPLAELATYLQSKQADFLVIDTVDAFLSWAGQADIKRVVQSLLLGLRKTAATVLLTISPSAPGLEHLASDVSGVIELAFEGQGRALRVALASWCRIDGTPVPFELVQRKGIRVVGDAAQSVAKRAVAGTDVINVADLSRVLDSLPPMKMSRNSDPEVTDVLPAVAQKKRT